MNTCIFIGNLGADVELRKTQSGKSVGNFNMAVRGNKTDNGYLSEWAKIIVWDSLADNCAKYIRKGSKVAVTARYSNRSYEDKKGEKKYITEFIAHDVQFLDPPKKQEPVHAPGGTPHKYEAAPTVEDIPF